MLEIGRIEKLRSNVLMKRLLAFFCKAVVAVALLYAFGRFSGELSSLAIAVIWAAVSALSAVAFSYPAIIKKHNTKEMFQDGSEASNRINGRVLRFAASFLLSAFLVASLMIESQKWESADWIVTWASIPLYCVVSEFICRRTLITEYKPFYQRRGIMLWSWAITGVSLTLIYVVVLLVCSVGDSPTLGEALSSTKLLFADSSSSLMVEIGKLGYLVDAWTAFGLPQIGSFAYPIFLVLSFILCASSSFALAHLLSLCSLKMPELLSVFQPIEEEDSATMRSKAVRQPVITLLLAVLILIAVFIYGERLATQAQQSQEYTAVESFIRNQINLVAYEADGKIYDKDTLDKTFDKVAENNLDYMNKREALKKVAHASYDRCLSNVDNYIKWRKSFITWLKDTFFMNDDRMRQEYRERIINGVDTNQLETDAQYYNEALSAMKNQVEEELINLQLNGIPDWLVVEKKPIEEYFRFIYLNDFLELKFPQSTSSDSEEYKQSVIQAIQDSRAEMLALVQ